MKVLYSIVFSVLALFMLSCAAEQYTQNIDNFIERREVCDHLRGEFPDPPNPVRAKEIEDGVTKYCTEMDAELAGLKVRYADNPEVMQRLNAYESRIERVNRP